MKIRGFRIELSEIEAVLAAAGGTSISAAAVKVLQDPAGQDQIVGYVAPAATAKATTASVSAGGSVVDIAALQGLLRQQLPGYMVPVAIICITEGFKTTANGKVDTSSLPVPDWAALERSNAGQASGGREEPANEQERAALAMFAEVSLRAGACRRSTESAIGVSTVSAKWQLTLPCLRNIQNGLVQD